MKKHIALSSFLVLALAACQPGSRVIKIGSIGPLSGNAGAIGQDVQHGIRLAIDEMNAAGGIAGNQVELIAEDGKCASGDAHSAARKLATVDKVVAILGGVCSGETLAAAKVTEPLKIVTMSPVSSSPDVTTAGDHVFRIYPSDTLKAKAMATYIANEGFSRLAILSEDTEYAIAFRDSLVEYVGSGAFVFNEVVEPGAKQFGALYEQLEDIEFEAFIANATQTALITDMIQQFREAAFEEPIVSHDMADMTEIAEALGDTGRETYVLNVPTAGSGTAFHTAFIEKFGQPKAGIHWAAYGYDAAKVLLQGLAHVQEEQTLQEVLLSMSAYKGVTGTIRFDANGDVAGVSYVVKQYQSGAVIPVSALSLD